MLNKIKNKLYKFLRATEKYTKTDMVYFARGNFWMAIDQFFVIGSGALVSIAFANLLSKEVFGVYKYILSIIGILSICSLNGMQSTIVQAVASGYEKTFIEILKLKVKWGLLGSFLSLILSIYYYINHNTNLSFCLLIVGIFLPFLNASSSYGALLNGKKNFKLNTQLSVISNFAIAISTIVTLILTNNIILIIFIYFFSRTIIYSILLIFTLSKEKLNNKIDKEAITFGKHLSLMGIFSIATEQLDKIIVWNFFGAQELAVYSIATLPISYINSFLLKNTGSLALPKLSSTDISTIKKTFPEKVAKFTALSSVIAILYAMAAPFIFHALFPQYTESVIYSQILAITIATIPISLLSSVLTSKKQHKQLYFISIAVNIIQVSLYLILRPMFGLMGIVYAITLTQIFDKIILIYLFKKI